MSKRPAVIALIVHHASLTPAERVGVRQCLRILSRHPIVVVAPEGLTLPQLLRSLPTERFPVQCFASVRDYNRLALSKMFYERFSEFEYMLIHQLDAFVFQDELLDWCGKDYDYIGAPWIGIQFTNSPEWEALLLPHLVNSGMTKRRERLNVGNGGFSLRRVGKMQFILDQYAFLRSLWSDRHEDAFWGIAARLCIPESVYRVPDEQEAMAFSIETQPEYCVKRIGKLPFGCHAWSTMAPSFWRPWIRRAGYRIHVPGDGGWQDKVSALKPQWMNDRTAPTYRKG